MDWSSSLLGAVECSICLSVLKHPCALPCVHTFCLQCLEELKKNSTVTCPECRAKHKVPPQGVTGFPTNPTVNRLLENVCRDCHKQPGLEKCEYCGWKTCADCTGSHAKSCLKEAVKALDRAKAAAVTYIQVAPVYNEDTAGPPPVVNQPQPRAVTDQSTAATPVVIQPQPGTAPVINQNSSPPSSEWKTNAFQCFEDCEICICGLLFPLLLSCGSAKRLGQNPLLGCFCLCRVRTLLREKYGIPGSKLKDFGCCLFFYSLSNCQIARELRKREGPGPICLH